MSGENGFNINFLSLLNLIYYIIIQIIRVGRQLRKLRIKLARHYIMLNFISHLNAGNKETRAKTLKEFKCCLVKFDTDKTHFEPILATTKNRDISYEYF